MESVVRFWAALLLLGLSVLPLTEYLFQNFKNKGYLFGKVIGLCMNAYLMWLLSSVRIMKFSARNAIICILVVAAICWGIRFISHRKKGDYLIRYLISEIGFLLFFLLFTYLMGNRIIGTETEKAMDYAFLTNISRTEYFPPVDTWAAGTTLNYYYFGQYLVTFLSKISFVKTEYAYTLGMAMIASLCVTLVYALVSEIMQQHMEAKEEKSVHRLRIIPKAAGAIASAMVAFCGNMHYVVFDKLVPMLWEILQIPGEKPAYWFASSTRYIGYLPDVEGDKTISEFPCYSFLIGDLHAHVIDIMIVLTILGLLLAWYNVYKIMCQPHLLMLAFLIGICSMTNFWDFPIYYVVCGSVILISNILHDKKRGIFETILQGIVMMIIIKLVSLPFSLQFEAMMMGIGICKTHSKLYQLGILWGFPVLLVGGFFISLIRKRKGSCTDIFILLMGLCAVGLVIMPEVIYVRDIYEAGFPRANTMFKLTYQAFILFGIAGGYIIAKFLLLPETKTQRNGGIAGLICVILTGGYFFAASGMWFGNYLNPNNFKTIDASRYYTDKLPEDMDAVNWIKEHVTKGQPVVLEADGESYSDYERVSVLTGLPTVLGWHTHEWLWKNGYSVIQEREADVTNIYTAKSLDTVKQLLEKYHVSYIFIGSKEYEKYGDINIDLLVQTGKTVYRNNKTMIIQVMD